MTSRRACIRCAVAATAIVIPLTAAAPASASALTPAEITGFTIAPAVISYDSQDINVSGALVESADTSTGIPDETIDIENVTDGATLATFTTGTGGTFGGTVDLPGAMDIRAVFYADTTGGYGGGASATDDVTATELPATISLSAPSQTQVWAGTEVTFTSTAQIALADGTVAPVADGSISLTGLGEQTTGANGTVSFTTQAEGNLLSERAELLPNSETAGDAFWTYTYSTTEAVITRYRTRVTGFHVAAVMEAHHEYWTTGTIQTWNGSAWTAAPSGLDVDIQYRYAGSSTWRSAATAQTNSKGYLASVHQMKPGTVYWRIWLPYQSAGNNYTASSAISTTSRVNDQTCTALTSASHVNGHTALSGHVRDWCASGQATFGAITGKTVQVYYRPRGSTTWRYLGWTRTGSGGNFTYTHSGTLHGTFKAVFPAQGYYLRSVSGSRTLK